MLRLIIISCLKAVFDLITKGLSENQSLKCSYFDQILLTVMKLRLIMLVIRIWFTILKLSNLQFLGM